MTTNRLSEFFNDDGIEDYVPEPNQSDVTLTRENYDELKCLISEVRKLLTENGRLREAVRSLDLDCRAAEIDQQAARRELAMVFAAKLKKLRRRATK